MVAESQKRVLPPHLEGEKGHGGWVNEEEKAESSGDLSFCQKEGGDAVVVAAVDCFDAGLGKSRVSKAAAKAPKGRLM
jgi:hypothetical protein